MAAVTVASVATAVEWPAAAAVCSCEVTAFIGTVHAAAAAAELRNSRTKPINNSNDLPAHHNKVSWTSFIISQTSQPKRRSTQDHTVHKSPGR